MTALHTLPATSISVRPLTASDTQTYRALRQRVLAIGDGKYFSDSFTREAALSESEWLEWCTEKREHCIMGTFDRDRLIGVMMITQHGNPEEKMVEWEAIWLDPAYRGQRIASLAYHAVEQWTLAEGYQKVALYIRADNAHSIAIHKKLGAEYHTTKYRETWADGSVADTHSYMLDLLAAGREQRQRQTITYLEKTLTFFHDDKALEYAARQKMAALRQNLG